MSTQYPICPRCGKNPADQMSQQGLCCLACLDKIPEVCDFCSAPHPAWDYPARSFDTGDTVIIAGTAHPTASTGDWAACDTCYHLIENNLWDGVARRSIGALSRTHPYLSPQGQRELYHELQQLHQQFRRHRLGAPRPWTARTKEVL